MKMHKDYLSEFNKFTTTGQTASSSVLLVDGLNLFLRAFSVVPTLNDNGEHIGGIIGFYNTLRKLIKDYNINRVIIAFDGKGGSQRRRKLYKEYKEKRVSIGAYNRFEDVKGLIDENTSLTRQLSILLTSLEFLPLHVLIFGQVEADDVLAYVAKHYFDGSVNKIIATSDKDYLQLIDESISIYSLHKKYLINSSNVYDTVGYTPLNYLTLRCFTGDISDNINGVNKVGEKLMRKFFNIDSKEENITIENVILESRNKVGSNTKTKAYHSIVEEEDIVHRNYKLMQLQDPPLSGNTTSHIRAILDKAPLPFNRYKFYEYLGSKGVSMAVDDYTIWTRFNTI